MTSLPDNLRSAADLRPLYERSFEMIEEAVRKLPRDSELRRELATRQMDQGKIKEALEHIRTAMKLERPHGADLLILASRASLQSGRDDEAINFANRAIKLRPAADQAYGFLGGALRRKGNRAAAAEAFGRALRLNSNRRTYRLAFGQELEALGQLERAERVYRHALMVDGDFGDAALNLANLLHRQSRYEEALATYRLTQKIMGVKPFLFSNIGALFRKMGRYAESHANYRRSLCMVPGDSGALYNLGNLYRAEGDLDEAVRTYRLSLAAQPDHAERHWNLSLALLADGRLEEGFDEYEWRWKYDEFPSRRRDFKAPMWNGELLDGKTLLLHTEQGIGDVLQFWRFLPSVIARKGSTGRVVLESHGELIPLVEGTEGIDEIIERFSPPPAFDYHIPLLSVARAMGVRTLQDLPVDVPYLTVPPGADFAVPEIDSDKLNVGFIFGGNPKFASDKERSTDLASWTPVLDVPGVRFFSLQKGARETDVAAAPSHVIRLNERITTFRDTAIAMNKLDLVISTCTSTAHLAGALGRPVWVVLAQNADWRWMVDRDDSPWYPTATLFRQSERGDWQGVFARIAESLREKAERHASESGGMTR
ncbi:MAG: tetratricopeptide repeat protein [Thalassobaculaceae bacterium]|nr:tetratricopeptide repeat protein [Thalassobaculaceae bacterium]